MQFFEKNNFFHNFTPRPIVTQYVVCYSRNKEKNRYIYGAIYCYKILRTTTCGAPIAVALTIR